MLKDSSERSEADWLKIQPLGLCARIISKHAYDEAVGRTLLRALEWVRANPSLHPAVDYVRAIHQLVFAGVHPWVLSPFSIAPRVTALEDSERLTVAAEVELTRRPADLLRRMQRRLGDGGLE